MQYIKKPPPFGEGFFGWFIEQRMDACGIIVLSHRTLAAFIMST
jgi:hypothetical protein